MLYINKLIHKRTLIYSYIVERDESEREKQTDTQTGGDRERERETRTHIRRPKKYRNRQTEKEVLH